MDIETLDKKLPEFNNVDKAICIPVVLLCSAAAVVNFYHSHYFLGTVLVFYVVYWANIVRTCFLMKQKSRVNSL